MSENITMYHGDTNILNLVVSQSGDPYDLTGSSLWMTAKNLCKDSDAAAIFAKTIGDGITIVDSTRGMAQIVISPIDTEILTEARTVLYYDVQLQDVSGNVWTLTKGNLIVNPDVTQDRS